MTDQSSTELAMVLWEAMISHKNNATSSTAKMGTEEDVSLRVNVAKWFPSSRFKDSHSYGNIMRQVMAWVPEFGSAWNSITTSPRPSLETFAYEWLGYRLKKHFGILPEKVESPDNKPINVSKIRIFYDSSSTSSLGRESQIYQQLHDHLNSLTNHVRIVSVQQLDIKYARHKGSIYDPSTDIESIEFLIVSEKLKKENV